MDPANAFRFRGTCTTCHKRSSYLNADSACPRCYTSDARPSAEQQPPLAFGAPPRRGWDIGVCIRCGFIRTCHDNVCRDCWELS